MSLGAVHKVGENKEGCNDNVYTVYKVHTREGGKLMQCENVMLFNTRYYGALEVPSDLLRIDILTYFITG